MADPVETISFVARRLIQFEQRFAKAPPPRRRAASELFAQVARSIAALAPELSRDHLPHDACRELALSASRLEENVADELGTQEAARLAEALGKACDKEALFLAFRTSDRKKHLEEELEKAAILIRALADGIYGAPGESASRPSASRTFPF